jgi:hypothetical protein
VRLGCGGCLTFVIFGLLATIGTSVWGTSRVLQNPAVTPVRTTAEDAARAQQKLFRLVRGSATDPVVVSESEINAFVSRNVDRSELPFDQPVIFLRDGDVVEIAGQVPVGRLIADSPLGAMGGLLPERWSAHPVWLQVAAHARLERRPRPQLRLDVRRLSLGQQRLPVLTLRLLFEPARLRFVRLTVPDTVAEVRIQSGRIVIRPTSSRERI